MIGVRNKISTKQGCSQSADFEGGGASTFNGSGLLLPQDNTPHHPNTFLRGFQHFGKMVSQTTGGGGGGPPRLGPPSCCPLPNLDRIIFTILPDISISNGRENQACSIPVLFTAQFIMIQQWHLNMKEGGF